MRSLGERRLDTTHGVAESLAIAPIISVGLAAYALAAYAGGATPAAMLIAFIGALCLGWVFVQFARRYAGAGTVYEYLARAGPQLLGVIVAGSYFVVAVLAAGGGLLSGLLIEDFCAKQLGFDPGWWAGGVAVLVVVALLLYLGVRLSTRLILTLSVIASLPLIVLAVVILAKGGAHGLTLAAFDPGRGDVVQALLYAVLLFGGFESAACLGEESRNPHRSIPRAMVLAIVACGVFYIFVLYAATMAFGMDQAAKVWGSNPLAVIDLGDKWVGAPLSGLIQAGTIVDLTAFLIAVTNVISRGYFVLARDGLLPRALSTVSRRGTPIGGIALVIGANAVLMLVAAPFDDRFQVFQATLTANPLISLVVYLVLCLLALRLLASRGGPAWGYAVVVVGAAVPGFGLYGSFVPFPHGARLAGLLIAVASVAVSAVWAVWLWVRNRTTILGAGRHARVAEPEGAVSVTA